MSLVEKLTSIKTKLTSVLSDINTALVAKGATEVTSLAEVPTAIESVQSGGGGVETIDDYEAYYTRPSWWLPYPELTAGDNINEIFLLMEVKPDVMEYDGIDLTNTPILRNGKKQFWKRIEGKQIEGEQPDLLEVYANCVDDWNFYHTAFSLLATGAYTGTAFSAFYPKLHIISGTPMSVAANTQNLGFASNLKKVDCVVKIKKVSVNAFQLSGITKAPTIEATISIANTFCLSMAMLDGGTIGGTRASNINNAFYACRNMEKIHICEPCSIVTTSFQNCCNLRNVTIEKGFTGSLYIHNSTKYTSEILHAIIENYADMTGKTAPTFQVGTTNLAKIDEEHIAMLEAKNINYS